MDSAPKAPQDTETPGTPASAPPNRAVPFLAAFNAIEGFLREELGAKKSDSFKWMTNLAAKKKVLTRHQADTLIEFAELRNAISHGEYNNLRPIAEPLPETVAEITQLREALLRPARALDVIQAEKVLTFSPDDDVREPLRALRETGHKQFPIYRDETYIGLLTTNALARWVAREIDEDNHLRHATVDEVLELSGRHDQPVFLARDVTAAAAVDALTTPLESGALPRLAIITESGNPRQRPLAVLVATEIPALLAAA